MSARRDVRRLLLVGFMGSGKSTVGPLVAARLGWTFLDFDARVQEEEGRSVARIFAEAGEPYFREVEARIAAGLLGLDRVVLGSGGGWAAAPGRLRGLPAGTVSVWLKVSAEEAVRRIREGGGGRPLLAEPDALDRARALLRARERRYAAAHFEVDTEGRAPEDVSALITTLVERPTEDHSVAGTR